MSIQSIYLKRFVVLIAISFVSLHYSFTVYPWLENLSLKVQLSPHTSFISPDSYPYWKFAKSYTWYEVPFNLIGPVVAFKLLGLNFDLVFFFNMFALILSSNFFAKICNFKQANVFLIVFLNPIILSTLFFVNKEVYILISGFVLVAANNSNDGKVWWTGLILALFTKLEYSVTIAFWFIFRKMSEKFWFAFYLALLLLISLTYSNLPLIKWRSIPLFANQKPDSLGVTIFLHSLAYDYHLFAIAFLPKVLQASLDGVISLAKDSASIMYNYVTISSSIIFSILTGWVMLNFKRLKNRTEIHFLLLWFVVVGLVPFSSHRYLVPCYPFLYYLFLKTLAYSQKEETEVTVG